MDNQAYEQQTVQTPNISLTGVTVDRLMMHLSNATVLAKGTDGAMHPFVDPNPVIAVLREAVMAEAKRLGMIGQDGASFQAPPSQPN